MKRFSLLFFLLLASTMVAVAQGSPKFTVKGVVFDSIKNEAMPFATVLLLDAQDRSKTIGSEYSGDDGSFVFEAPKGDYFLEVNYVGYAPYETEFSLSANKDFGAISIGEGITIGAAQVVAQLITTDVDKTTYHVGSDIEAPVLTVLEMMRKVPMLTVDGEDNVRLKGATNFKILVNGKSSSLMTNNYKEVLRSMPAASIKSIEVITNPPARYDAEGIGGIINIVTNRKAPEGFSGSVYTSGSTLGDWNAGTYLAGTAGKFNVSGNVYLGEYRSPENLINATREDFHQPNSRYQNYTSKGDYTGNYQGLSLEMSYEFDSLNLLSFSVNGTLGGSDNNTNSMFDIYNEAHILATQYNTISSGSNGWGGVGASLDYQRSFAKRKDQSLTASYKLDYNPSDNAFDSKVDVLHGSMPSYHQRSDNKAWGMEHALQVDYFDPLTENHQIETGAKFTIRPSQSNTFNEMYNGTSWVEDTRLKNDLDYQQYIGSVYAAYQYKIKKFSAKAGARMEYTVNDGTFKSTEDTPLFNRYFNLVPYLTFGYKIDDVQNLRLGYTQRISRPGIWLLNPYVNNQEPMRMSTGNPNLAPELSHTFDLGYGIYKPMFNINASFTTSITNNSIEQMVTVLENGVSLQKPENIGVKNSYMGSLSAGARFFSGKLSFHLNFNGGYVAVKANNGTGLENSGWQHNAFMQISGQPWKGGTVSIMGGYGKNDISLQNKDLFYYFSGMSVAHGFLEGKLRLSLNAQNPWTKYQYFTMSQGDPNFQLDLSQRTMRQTLRVGLTWRFGTAKGSVKRVKRSIDSSDQKGGGQAGGGQAGGTGGGMGQ